MKISSWCLLGEEVDHPKDISINQMLEELLEKQPELKKDIALVNAENNKTVTYNELNEIANCLARVIIDKIRNNNMTPNSDGDYVVALRFLPGEELVATILAIFKAGIAYVPIAPSWPEGRIQHIIADAAPVMLLTNVPAEILNKAQRNFSEDDKRLVFHYQDLLGEARDTKTSVENVPSNLCLNGSQRGDRLFAVLYTSGSTGTPKGVRHLHRAAINRFYWQWNSFPYRKDEVCIFKTVLTFVDSILEIWSPLLSGKRLVIVPTKVTQNVEKFVDVLEEYKIGRVLTVTSLIRSILAFLNLSNSEEKRLSCVKIWELTGEPVPKDVVLEFFKYYPSGHRVSNIYDSTEMLGATRYSFSNATEALSVLRQNKVPIGLPIDNSKAYVLDDNLKPVGEEITGNLYFSGINLSCGYVGVTKGGFMKNHFNKSSDNGAQQQGMNTITKTNMYDVLYKTGDFATISQGIIYYEGRLDSQIKVRGHRVDLAEIEKAVYEVEGVAKAGVLCYRPGDAQQKVICYYTAKEGVLLPETKVENKLSPKLVDYMMPKLFKLTALPLLTSGKTDRQALLVRYEESLNHISYTFSESDISGYGVKVEKLTEAKIVLESVASVILDSTHKPTLADNFFKIGGDSVNMVMTIAKIAEHGYNISVTDFVSAGNLAETVAAVSTKHPAGDVTKGGQKYISEQLEEGHKEIVIDMVSRSFADKEVLFTLVGASYEDMKEYTESMWDDMLRDNLSVVIKNKKGNLIGVCLNFDGGSEGTDPSEPKSDVNVEEQQELGNRRTKTEEVEHGALPTIFQFLTVVEDPLKEQHIPTERGKFVSTSIIATAKDVPTTENVEVVLFMEEENVRLAKLKGFKGIFSINTNRLAQLISRSLGYEIFSTHQVNQYEDAEGARPFFSAEDDVVVEMAIKKF